MKYNLRGSECMILVDKFKKPKYGPQIILALVILVQGFIGVYWASQKNDYHIDETYSLVQANSGRNLVRSHAVHELDYFNRWHNQEFFVNLMTVHPDERFNFLPIYQTTSKPHFVHPPFYHFQLHFVSSLFPGTWNKFMGASINLVWIIGTTVLLYLTGQILFNERWKVLLAPIMWAYSASAMNHVVYFRMYATLIFFFTALSYLGLILIKKRKDLGKKFYFSLFVVFFLGGLTQYYFFIFLLLSVIFLTVWLVLSKEYKILRNCAITAAASASAYLLFWPHAITHLTSSTAEWVIRYVSGRDNYYSLLRTMGSEVMRGLFGLTQASAIFGFIFLILLALTTIYLYGYVNGKNSSKIKKRKLCEVLDEMSSINLIPIMYLFIVTSIYFLIVTRIMPFISERYIVAIFPSIVIIFWLLIDNVLTNIRIHRKAKTTILVCLLIFLTISNLRTRPIYLFQYDWNAHDMSAIIARYNEPVAIAAAFGPRGPVFTNHVLDLAYYDRAFIANELYYFEQALKSLSTSEDLFIFVRHAAAAYDAEEVFEIVESILGPARGMSFSHIHEGFVVFIRRV